jgi:MFS family permease
LSIRFILFITVLAHLSFAGCRVILSLTAIHEGASPFTVGLVLSLLTIIPILFVLRWGRWVDRVGVRLPMLIGVAAILLAMVIGWAFPRMETLFLVSPLAGSGFFLYHIAAGQAAAMIGRPEDRVKNFSLLALAFSTANFIGPTVSGFAIDTIGHDNAMLVLSVGALVGTATLAWCKNDVPRHDVSSTQHGKRDVYELLRIPGFRLVFMVSGVLSVTWDLFSFVIPIHGSQLGLSATMIGLILGTFGSAVFVVRLLLPLFVHRIDEWRILIAAMVTSGATLLVFPFVHGVPLLMTLSFLLGVGLGGTQPFIMALLYAKAPAGRGAEVLSMRTWLINVSQTGVPLTFGALGAMLGMLPVFLAMGASLLSAGWLATRAK